MILSGYNLHMIVTSDFVPAKYMTNPHVQSAWPTLLMRKKTSVKTKRERVDLPDGDFMDLEWHDAGVPPCAPIVILLHGITGDINAPYIKYIMPTLAKQGWRSVMMYYRGYSGEHNRANVMTHAGKTDDFAELVKLLHAREPETIIAAVGFSQGGNMLLKYLGEVKGETALKCAVAVSPPFQLRSISNRIRRGMSRFYQWYLLTQLREFYRRKFRYRPAPFDLNRVSELTSFWQFDDNVTAPVHGFRNAVDYYRQASCERFLPTIEIPTLIIHAKDDPIMTPDIIPTENKISKSTTLELSENGGHLGFVSGTWRHPIFWLNQRIPEFLAEYLGRS